MGWSVIRPDRAGGGPGTMRLRQLAAREVAGASLQPFPRFRFETIDSTNWTFSAVRNATASTSLEVGATQIVRAFVAAPINLNCRRADQVPIRIERAQQPRLVGPHVGLNALQRILGDEECSLH